MGNFFSDLTKDIGKAVSKAAKDIGKATKDVAKVASVIPGPWQTPAQVITLIDTVTSKSKNPADTAAGMIQQGADAQTAYQIAALKQQQELMDRQLGTATADKQMAYDINRQQFLANQQNILPYQMASLSALQALPQLQQLLGLQAYNLPQTIAQFTPPEVNYARMYQQTQQQLFPDSTGAATAAPATQEPATGLRINQPTFASTSGGGFMGISTPGLGAPTALYNEFVAKMGRAPEGEVELYNWRSAGKPTSLTPAMINAAQAEARGALPGANAATSGLGAAIANYQPGAQGSMRPEPGVDAFQQALAGGGQQSQGTTTNQALSAYTGPAYDLNNSPLYLWQKQQAEEALTNQLAAAGLSGGTYAQRELSRQNQGLAAAERERVVSNLSSMVNLGMGGAKLGQASFTTPQSTDIMSAYQMGGNNISSIYGNLGAIQGQLGSQLAQNYMAGYNAQQKQTSPIQDALALASSYGWLGGSSKTTNKSKDFWGTMGPVMSPI